MTAKEFEELALNGHNYPTWAMDIKISLDVHDLLKYVVAIEGKCLKLLAIDYL